MQLGKRCGLSIGACAKDLGISRSSYYRYAKAPELRKRRGKRKGAPLTPSEKRSVVDAALLHPLTGYKRLTHLLQNELEAGVRAHQVHSVLKEHALLGPRCTPLNASLRRPKAPSEPNEVWHIDLMYLRVNQRWFYLVDVLDAYSRYIVHWTLNPTMQTHTVTLTVQEALEKWRPIKPPAIVHDSGCQFMSKDWRDFAERHGMPSIRTRVAHPESNGLIERLHRTHRAEALLETEYWTLEQARAQMTKWVSVYNSSRPHFALNGLPPVVYYLGEPDAALAQREHFVLSAAAARANYWRQQPQIIS